MKSNLLESAKKFQKERKWDLAIDYFQQYLDENNGKSIADTYVSYAKCLRIKGHTNKAEEILDKGRDLHPNSERILLELHNLYDSLGDWNSAELIARTLVDMNPKEANYYFRLGRSYAYLNNDKMAKDVYKQGLKHKHNLPFEDLISQIEKGFPDEGSDIFTDYVFINGKNNLGGFIHYLGNQKYFTKIARYTRGAKREEKFYKKLSSNYPVLKNVVPEFINSQVLDNTLYLTLEMIEDGPEVSSEHTQNIIKTAEMVSSFKYKDIINKFPNPNFLFQMKKRPIYGMIFFTQIHKKHINEKLFSSLYHLVKENRYPNEVKNVIEHLESLVMNNHLYALIKPEIHYSLLHGDFIPQNIKLDRDNESPIVFDWATSLIGPHFMDIARYLSVTFLPYSEIKENYLFNNVNNKKLSLIEQIFFLYALIILYLLINSKKVGINDRLSKFIIPALEDMETLIAKFKIENFGSAIQFLVNENEKDKDKINKMNSKIKNLVKTNRKLQESLKDLMNSKSWKITAPLRNFRLWRDKFK